MSRWLELARRIPPVWLVLGGIASVQFGATIAKAMFAVASPTMIVWLRLAISSVLLLAIARPSLRGRRPRDLLIVAAFGASLGLMNWSIYQSFARIPLGLAVTIEFLGPLGVALAGSRRARDVIWVGLAAAGVALLGFGSGASLDPVGVAYAVIAAACWAGYILLGARLSRSDWSPLSGLALGSTLAALALTFAVIGELPSLSPWIVAAGLGIGLLSSAIPYSLELTALRTMPPRVFGILMSLEPAAAALFALLVLGELLSISEWAAVACVIAASVGATRFSARPPDAPAPT